MAAFINKIGTEKLVGYFSDSPSALAYLEANFGMEDRQGTLELLLSSVDESSFTLRQWVDALMVLSQWLEVRRLSLSVEDKLGYVCCAAEAVNGSASVATLPAAVDEMLESYGCDRASKI